MFLRPNHFHLLSEGNAPELEIVGGARLPFIDAGEGRHPRERLWLVNLAHLQEHKWQFRVHHNCDHIETYNGNPYTTTLRTLWFQEGRVYAYQPAPLVSPPKVVKVDAFQGSLSTRALYVYLPRGYEQHVNKRYPVIYMHDGQNCFETFVQDSFVGSWQAEIAASNLIQQGLMRECIIVGVSHGGSQRAVEYAPDYAELHFLAESLQDSNDTAVPALPKVRPFGQASRTVAYYRDDVAPFIEQHYRTLLGRDNRATCGSSLGGLLSLVFAWDYPDFARHHAALSPSLWVTRRPDDKLEMVERFRLPHACDFRLWLDSGEMDTPRNGDDGKAFVLLARDVLLENCTTIGENFHHYVHRRAMHSEEAWARRLPLIYEFLFPYKLL